MSEINIIIPTLDNINIQVQTQERVDVILEDKQPVNVVVSNVGLQGDKGDQGIPGNVITKQAAQDLSSGRLVYIENGLVHYMNYNDINLIGKSMGITRTAALSGQPIDVFVSGVATVSGWGLIPLARYFAASNGLITNIVPSDGVIQNVGTAISNTELHINFNSPIIL